MTQCDGGIVTCSRKDQREACPWLPCSGVRRVARARWGWGAEGCQLQPSSRAVENPFSDLHTEFHDSKTEVPTTHQGPRVSPARGSASLPTALQGQPRPVPPTCSQGPETLPAAPASSQAVRATPGRLCSFSAYRPPAHHTLLAAALLTCRPPGPTPHTPASLQSARSSTHGHPSAALHVLCLLPGVPSFLLSAQPAHLSFSGSVQKSPLQRSLPEPSSLSGLPSTWPCVHQGAYQGHRDDVPPTRLSPLRTGCSWRPRSCPRVCAELLERSRC